MTCESCPSHNFEANRLPIGDDDPCNTSGAGVYCPGSYWYYNADDATGQDLIDGGDCDRLFQRTGEVCGMDQWLEIPLRDTQYSADAPTLSDCCPAGTLWIRPDNLSGLGWDEVYMSYADFSTDPPTCAWCLICTTEPIGGPVFPDTISVESNARSNTHVYDDFDGNPATDIPLAVSTTTGLSPVSTSITNPSLTRNMTVMVVWSGYVVDMEYQKSSGGINFIHSVQPYMYLDAILQNTPFGSDVLVTHIGSNRSTTGTSMNTGLWTTSLTIGPGATVTASMEASFTNQFNHNADIAARINIENGNITMHGVLV